MDCSLPGSSVHGLSQARILKRVAIPFPDDLPDSGIEPRSSALQADSLPSEPSRKLAVKSERTEVSFTLVELCLTGETALMKQTNFH